MRNIHIKRVTELDFQEINALRKVALTVDVDAFGGDREIEINPTLEFKELWKKLVSKEESEYLAAFDINTKACVSMIKFCKEKNLMYSLQAIFTHPDYRKQGIVKELLSQILEILKKE